MPKVLYHHNSPATQPTLKGTQNVIMISLITLDFAGVFSLERRTLSVSISGGAGITAPVWSSQPGLDLFTMDIIPLPNLLLSAGKILFTVENQPPFIESEEISPVN